MVERESLSNEEIQKLYWACDALVFPSLWYECQPKTGTTFEVGLERLKYFFL